MRRFVLRVRAVLGNSRFDGVLVSLCAVLALPLVVAACRAVIQHWMPLGDDALVALRAQDVLTAHHPWLGTWSSASLSAGVDLNHPGPLLFESVALAVRVFGSRVGVAVGVALVNMCAIGSACYLAYRRVGRRGVIAAACGVCLLMFIMGSDLLVDPWNPHILLIPCFALLVATWSVVEGDGAGLLLFVVLGSYCVQTHLGYSYFVPGLLIGAMVVRFVSSRRTSTWRERVLFSRRSFVASCCAMLLLWLQPLYEEVFGSGKGNLSRILGAAGSNGVKIGWVFGFRLLSSVLTWSPLSLRRGFTEAIPDTPYAQGGALASLHMAGVGALLVRCMILLVVSLVTARAARRSGNSKALLLIASSWLSVAVAWVSVSIMPLGPLGLSAHQMRWMWPIGAFFFSAHGGAWLLLATRHHATVLRLLVVGVAAISLANLPRFLQPVGPLAKSYEMNRLAELDSQLGVLEGRGTLWFDTSNTPVFDNWSASVMAELRRRDIPFVVNEPGLVRQLGEGRRMKQGPYLHLMLQYGANAFRVVNGFEVVGRWSSLSGAEETKLADYYDRILAGEVLSNADAAQLAALERTANRGSVAVVIEGET